MRNLILLSMLLVSTCVMAQDDDLYFVPEKPKKQQKLVVAEETAQSKPSIEVYNNSSRNEDEYNRMYSYSGATQNAGSADGESLEAEYEEVDGTDYENSEDDFTYSRRIVRFRSPRVGLALSSPFYWDLVYSYGAYDYLYDSYYYDPFFWGYGWRYGWSWGPWDSWYGPIWGWSSVHHLHYWGCGPMWGGIHGPVIGVPRQHHNRGTFDNRIGRGERIRTSALASNSLRSSGRTSATSGRTSSWGRGEQSAAQQRENTRVNAGRTNGGRTSAAESSYSRYQRSRSMESSSYRGTTSSERQRSSEYTRPSSTRRTTERTTTTRENNTRRTTTNTTTNTRSSQSTYRSTPSTSSGSRSSFSTGGSSMGRSGGGSFGGSSGGSSRGGRR